MRPAGLSAQDLSLRDLRAFLVACETCNFSHAALHLGVAQPSLSRTIRNLEGGLRVKLFYRTGRGVELTAEGETLRDYADRIMGQAEELVSTLAARRGRPAGELVVLLPHYVSRILVPPLVKRCCAVLPKVEVHIFEESAVEVPARICSGSAGLGVFYQSHQGVGISQEAIATEQMYLVGLPDIVGTLPIPITLEDAARIPLIISSRYSPFRRFVERAASEEGLQLKVARELEVSYSALTFAREGEGAAVLPLSHFHEELDNGKLVARPIKCPRLTRNILIGHGMNASRPIVNAVSAILREIIAAHGKSIGWTLV
jgi:LysR family nitrogen assimilation transcriptional regulator